MREAVVTPSPMMKEEKSRSLQDKPAGERGDRERSERAPAAAAAESPAPSA
jgi:hypothetical protein